MQTVFWNIDTQYDFMRPDGRLYVEGAEQIEPNLEALTKYAKETGTKVVNTADWHNGTSQEISDNPDFQTTFPPHCLKETKGAEYIPATQPESPCIIDWEHRFVDINDIWMNRNTVLYKDAFDVFEGTPFAQVAFAAIGDQRAVVYGVAANVCVDYAVQGLRERRVEVYVPTDAIKELPNSDLEALLKFWEKEKGVNLLTTKDILEGLK